MTEIEAWHFVREDRRMNYGSEELIEAGRTYRFEGTPKLCKCGLHAAEKAFDALSYAPGPIICRVRLSGEIVRGEDKFAATERHVIWMADATETLRAFSRWCALQVIHLWNAPDVVKQYLETGDESLRAAAWDAARAAARDAARDAARAAARAAAWDAAWDAARAAARDVAWDAAWDAARAAWDAAGDALIDKCNTELTARLMALTQPEQ